MSKISRKKKREKKEEIKELKKLEDICQLLNELQVEYERSIDEQTIFIRACSVGNNFYDYGEDPKQVTFYPEFYFLANDPRVYIRECAECCGCSGW